MKILVTGSAGHLGEALVRQLRAQNQEVLGLDLLGSAFTDVQGSIANRDFVRDCMSGVSAVLHAATLHKPHVATHSRRQFVETNITGTLNLLEEAVAAGASCFIFTSTTSAFGRALTPPPGSAAAWITEEVRALPKNIYGASKTAAEDLCQLFWQDHGLPCLILRTSRFFPEEDDRAEIRQAYEDGNLKANEFLYRRVELEDAVGAHLLALERAESLGFGKYIISATTPFKQDHLLTLRENAAELVERLFPDYLECYRKRSWRMFPGIERVYVNEKARRELGWQPRYDFRRVLDCLKNGEAPRSELARVVGSKGYHQRSS